jgi:membrane protein
VAYTPSLLSQVKRWPDAPGHRFALTLAILKALWAVQPTPERGLSNEALARALRTDPLQIEPLLEALQALDWVGLLNEAGDDHGGRFVLLCNPDQTPAVPLLDDLLLRRDGVSEGFWGAARLDTLTLAQVLR